MNDRDARIVRSAFMIRHRPGVLSVSRNCVPGRIVLASPNRRPEIFPRRGQNHIAGTAPIRQILFIPVRFIARQMHHLQPAGIPPADHTLFRTGHRALRAIPLRPIGDFIDRLPRGIDSRYPRYGVGFRFFPHTDSIALPVGIIPGV